MKVKIFTEGGENIGYGHLSRCYSLYEEIRSREIDVELIVCGDIENIEFLKNVPVINFNWLDDNYLLENICVEDYAIVDSYKANKNLYDIIASKSKKALFIDDIGRIEYPKGVIVNPALDTSGVNYSIKAINSLLSGAKYVILRSVFIGVEREKTNERVNKVLVIMGGTDTRNLNLVILNEICSLNNDIEFHFVLSNFQYEKFSAKNNRDNVHAYKDLSESEMCDLMIGSDLAITGAGQTIYELIATQTPFIAIQVAENQQNNIRALKDNISSEIVLSYDDDEFANKLQEVFENLMKYEARKDLVTKFRYVIDGYGRCRIIDALLDKSASTDGIFLRKIRKEDIVEVYNLSNKDYVRQYSINKNKISWENHVDWFINSIQDTNLIFYVVTDHYNSFLGQIRYKIEEINAIVSISISEKLKGKGLSGLILKHSINSLFQEKESVNLIIAFVSEDNVASMNLFIRLNFEEAQSNEGMKKLILRRSKFHGD